MTIRRGISKINKETGQELSVLNLPLTTFPILFALSLFVHAREREWDCTVAGTGTPPIVATSRSVAHTFLLSSPTSHSHHPLVPIVFPLYPPFSIARGIFIATARRALRGSQYPCKVSLASNESQTFVSVYAGLVIPTTIIFRSFFYQWIWNSCYEIVVTVKNRLM